MKTLVKLTAPLLASALVLGLPVDAAQAQDSAATQTSEPKINLESDVMAIVTATDETGAQTTTLAEPTEYTPGTKLSFGVSYSNSGTESATNVTGTNPLNAAVRLAPDADPALLVSVDGGATFATLDTLTVTTETEGTRAATHADVTHVRWTIASIAPGESGRVAFPVIIR